MASGFKNFLKGIGLIPNSTDQNTVTGDENVLDTDGKKYYHNGTSSSATVTEKHAAQGTARLENKDLADNTTAIVDNSDTTKKIKFDAVGTTGTTTTIASSQTANRTITLPDATDTLVAKNTTDTLTNKTLTAPSIDAISNLTTNGFVKTSGSNGTLSVDTNTYLTGNQTITLSGDVAGSGATSIATTLATVNADVGSFTNSNITVNAKGLITAASNGTASLSPTLTNTHLYVGNGSNVATDVAVSGDLTLANTGAFTIANLAVTNAKIANATIDLTTKVTGALPIANAGTNITTYTTGDILYASATNTLSKLPIGSATNVLSVSGGIPAWTSSSLTAPRSQVRVFGANGFGSTNTVIRRFSTTSVSGTSITLAQSATLGDTFTIAQDGIYSISYFDNGSAAPSYQGISLNSAQLTTSIISITAANVLSLGVSSATALPSANSWTGFLTVGDVIRAHTDASAAGSNQRCGFMITQVSK